MSKIRISKIAKELGVDSKEVIDVLNKNMGLEVKSHLSSVEESVVQGVVAHFRNRTQAHNAHRSPAPREENPRPAAGGQARRDERRTGESRSEQRTGARTEGRQEERRQGERRGTQRPEGRREGRSPERRSGERTETRTGERRDARAGERTPNRGGAPRTKQMGSAQGGTGQGQRTQGGRSQGMRRGGVELATPIAEGRRNERGANGRRRDKDKKSGGRDKGQSLLSSYDTNKRNSVKKRNEQHRQAKEREVAKAQALIATHIELDGPLTVKALSEKMGREVSEIIKKLMLLGVMATINQEIDVDTAELIATDFGVTVAHVDPPEDPTEIEDIVDAPESLQTRPPVVTIMGHVDHGKTSLLDVIRKTNVTASEAGGITQHIGAYMVRYGDHKITFLDTPGHEAFTAMRLRGAQSTDIAVLVVAADDGVMPQTIEAINHAKSAAVPILVAINKMDKPGANPDHVKQQLAEHGLISEEWGGDTIMVPVSAKKQEGIEDLLENILLVAEVMELKANPNRRAQGIVIEAQLDKGRGPVCTVLVQKGTLHVGDTILAGTAFGKVRAMTNERGEKVKSAKPSMPVEVLGLSDVPAAGEIIDCVDDSLARSIAEKRAVKVRAEELKATTKVTLDDIFHRIQEGELKELNLILKADVQGSVEALRQSLEAIKSDEVRIVIVHAAVGAINESDVMLASASNAIIIGFNVRPDATVRKVAEKENVDLRTYRVIYDAIQDVEQAVVGLLAPEFKEVVLGRAEVRQVISAGKVVVAGSYVTEGKITNKSQIRLIRDGIVVHEGQVDSLRRFKDEAKEVQTGFECGISLEKFRDIKEGDVIEAFMMEEIAPTSL